MFPCSIWAISTLGFGYDKACGTNCHINYVYVATDDPAGDRELVRRIPKEIDEDSLPRLDWFW